MALRAARQAKEAGGAIYLSRCDLPRLIKDLGNYVGKTAETEAQVQSGGECQTF